jgi:outer membrane receptor protein involved in Fe transport
MSQPLKVLYTGAYMTRHISLQGDYTNYSRTGGGTFYQCTGGNTGWGTGAPYCYSPGAYWTEQLRTTHESHEFRVTTPEGKRIRAIIGGYYESFKIQDDSDWDYRSIPACTAGEDLTTAVCVGTVGPVPGSTINIPGQQNSSVAFGEDIQRGYKQYAAFGSVDFDITPTLTLTGGTRYYNYSEYESGSEYYTTKGGCYEKLVCTSGFDLATAGPNGTSLNTTFHGFKSRAVLTWKPQPHTLVYALFSQGFRPGLFNRGGKGVAPDPQNPSIDQLYVPAAEKPDTLTNWEIGLKTDLLDHKVQLNLSGYYMVWENVQFGYFNPQAGFGNTAFGITGPSYHIKGIEAQVVTRPLSGLSVQGSATYNDSKQANQPCFISNIAGSSSYGQCIMQVYNANNPAQPIQVTSPFGHVGDVTPFSPHVQANLRGRYDWAGKANINWFVAGGISYTGSMYNQPSTYPSGDVADGNTTFQGPNGVVIPGTTLVRYRMTGYALVDSSFGFTRDNITLTIFGENLANTHASTFTSAGEFIKTQVPVRPRIYGLKISSKF